jgi:hypothetical protein
MNKFCGEYKKLKHMGYKFQKLYADNYKTYRKDNILIWVMDNDVQIGHLSAKLSGIVIDMVCNDTYPVFEEAKEYYRNGRLTLRFEIGEPKSCLINENTGEIVERKKFMKARYKKYPNDIGKYLDYYATGFEEFNLGIKCKEAILELYKKGWFLKGEFLNIYV